MDKIKVLIADDVEETRSLIAKILELEKGKFQVVGHAADGLEVLELVPRLKPDVVLMDINMPKMNGLLATEAITSKHPEVIVVMMSVQGENEYLRKAMFSGAKEYLIKPVEYDSLVGTLVETYAKYRPRPRKAEGAPDKETKIFAFYSAKGGVGKSVVAVNAALSMSRCKGREKTRTLLVDLDLKYGDLGILMGMNDRKNILDMVDGNQLESFESMSEYLVPFNDQVDVLLAPKSPEGGEYISRGVLEKVFGTVKKHYDYILVDTGVNYDETTLYALDVADKVVLVSTLDLPSVKNTKLAINVMGTLQYSREKVKVVLNRSGEGAGLKEKEIAEVFGEHMLDILPSDPKAVSQSVNLGSPLCARKAAIPGRFMKKIQEMCCKLDA
ncbi:AAA family ATPase [Anaerotalea alkaliphila]|uniref:Stage 0 sporulation protein A homolog n=1 Tax=Anaerotalea alkaliphila TaxID=2662126 RepID=A0A7X5HVD2_9FIRM|nr:response regulator [Anaerotalea alkaliphila]NDL67333.1 response regulator/pilus assembly protein [Anaerotalea alkaliphila]